MNIKGFSFSPEKLNRLFPFYVLVDEQLTILSVGKSMAKLVPHLEGKTFLRAIKILRPSIENPSYEDLKAASDQLLVWDCGEGEMKTSFRGQLEWFEKENQLLMIGSPWFGSVDQLVEKKLSIRDFAFHDPLIDLLHVLKNQEITSEELKVLLKKVNQQKKELQIAGKAVQDIALFPMQNPDPLFRLNEAGEILVMNPAAKAISTLEFKNVVFKMPDFWKAISPQIDKNSERWLVEARSGNQTFSFVCKYLPEPRYFNVYGRNITEQKTIEEEIKRLSLVASANENGILFANPDGSIFWANEGL